MAITGFFREAVKREDVLNLRIMMTNSLLVDPTFNEFNEMNDLVRGVKGLYQDHDGRGFIFDKSAWNDDYMNKLMVQVETNFSNERIDHLKKVIENLRPVAARQKQADQKPKDETRRPCDRGVKIAGWASAGGIVGGTIAGIAGWSVFVGAITGVVISGAIAAITMKEDDEDE